MGGGKFMSNEQIRIDDNLKTYDVVNKEGKFLCNFTFNPSDTGIVDRYKEVSKNLSNMATRMAAESSSNEEKAKKAEDYIRGQFDYLFDADVSGTIFTIMGPMSLMGNSQIFAEYVMGVIANVVKKESGVYLKKLEMRIKKHTSKYHG